MSATAAGGLKKMVAAALTSGIAEARSRVFGHVLNPTSQITAHKVLRKKLIGQQIASWYPHDINFDDPAFIAKQNEQRLAKNEMLKRRGKGPPKKGQGKRASKRK